MVTGPSHCRSFRRLTNESSRQWMPTKMASLARVNTVSAQCTLAPVLEYGHFLIYLRRSARNVVHCGSISRPAYLVAAAEGECVTLNPHLGRCRAKNARCAARRYFDSSLRPNLNLLKSSKRAN